MHAKYGMSDIGGVPSARVKTGVGPNHGNSEAEASGICVTYSMQF